MSRPEMCPDVTVIVPVYKTESYLRRCVDSILNQTHQNIEVILIDDGSPDRCGEICDAYAAKDPRIVVFHTPNQGVAAARNTALDHAKGKYIAFCDSDDAFMPRMVEQAFRMAEDERADVVFLSYSRVEGDQVSSERHPVFAGTITCDQFEQRLNDILDSHIEHIWNKLYRNSLLQSHSLRFEKLRIGEDTVFNYKVLQLPGLRIASCQDVGYIYYVREGSAMKRYQENIWPELRYQAECFEKMMHVVSKQENEKRITNEYLKAFMLFTGFLSSLDCPLTTSEKALLCKKALNEEKMKAVLKTLDTEYIHRRSTIIKMYLFKFHLYRMAVFLADQKNRWDSRRKKSDGGKKQAATR